MLCYSAETYDIPINSDSDERKDAGGYGARCTELRKDAPRVAESPVVVKQIDKVEQRVEDGLQTVGQRQIHQEVVCDAAHAPVSDNYPHDDGVAGDCDHDHRHKRHCVKKLRVPRQHVGVTADHRRRCSLRS